MLAVHGLVVERDGRPVLHGVDLAVGPGETVAVIGASGSGKTTLLRAVAGLEPVRAGTVGWDGRDLASVPPHVRRFGLVFQDHALFPHRDVAANVGFGLRMEGWSRAARDDRVAEVLALVGLSGLAARRPAQLSGGERQRVALARALAPSPRLLMLDEPLASLDRPLRARLLDEIRAILSAVGTPAVYVTHDRDEAFAIGDRLVVLHDGRVEQDDRPERVWAAPRSEVVAALLGFGAAVDVHVDAEAVATPWGPVPVPLGAAPGPARAVVRPGGWIAAPAGAAESAAALAQRAGAATAAGVVVHATPGAGRWDVVVGLDDGGAVRAVLDGAAAPAAWRARVVVRLDPASLVLLPAAG